MIVITKTVTVPGAESRAAYFRGRAWMDMLDAIRQDLGDQVRANILRHGEPGGDWPQLSGYGQGKESKSYLKEKRRLDEVKRGYGTRADLASYKADRARLGGESAHAGYAYRKGRDHHAGKIPFGADTRGRRTGDLFAAVDGKIRYVDDGAAIDLIAAGLDRDGVPNRSKLEWLAKGGPGRPARNPAAPEDMSVFEQRVRDRLIEFLENAPRALDDGAIG